MTVQTRVDFHVHTTLGSPDSSLKPIELAAAANRRGLDVVVLAEHSEQWTDERAATYSAEHGFTAIAAREWTSPFGHIIILGLGPGSPWTQPNPRLRAIAERVDAGDDRTHERGSVAAMRQIVDDHGGFMIIAHPFRYFPGGNSLLYGETSEAHAWSPAELARHPVFDLVDEIEVKNGGCNVRENALAREVARVLGKAGVAGSDAHSSFTVGLFSTTFDGEITGLPSLMAGLRAGEYHVD